MSYPESFENIFEELDAILRPVKANKDTYSVGLPLNHIEILQEVIRGRHLLLTSWPSSDPEETAYITQSLLVLRLRFEEATQQDTAKHVKIPLNGNDIDLL